MLGKLGSRHAMVVHGCDGLDEITITGPTLVAELKAGVVSTFEVSPEDFGVERAPLEAIRGGDAQRNAEIVREVLRGEKGPCRDVVVLNADSVIFGDVADFIGGRDQAPTRLLVTLDRASPDFDGLWRFVGLSTMDRATLARIGSDTEDLYRDLWKRQLVDGEVDLVPFTGLAIDGGTPANLLAANLVESEGRTVVEPGAAVDGTAEQCLVLAGGEVRAGEHLRHCVVGRNARFELLSNSIVPAARS